MRPRPPKRQHYVPQWYLRRFRDPSAKEGRNYVAAYDRQSNTQHQRMAVKNVAVESNLYTLTAADDADAYIVEALLARRDEFDLELTSRILKECKVDHDDIPDVKQLIAIQHFRTRSLRELLRHMYRDEEQPKLAAELMKEGPPSSWPAEQQVEFWRSVDELKEGKWIAPDGEDGLLALQFGDDGTFLAGLDLFRGFILVVLINEAFVTSDNPIVARRLGFPQWDTIMKIGLAHAEELWFPLGPRHALMATRSSQISPTQIGLSVSQVRSINNALMRASDRWTIWQRGSAADQFLDLPADRTVIAKGR